MWVMAPDGIGILFKIANVCEVHLVDEEDGSTLVSAYYSIKELRQARYEEIPECRRGESKEWFNKKGYI